MDVPARAEKIVDQLQDWIYDTEDLSSIPDIICVFTSSRTLSPTTEIRVWDWVLWSSDEDKLEDLTFEYCLDSFLTEIDRLLPFLRKAGKL